MATGQENSDISRVMLWSLPRSVSTSFLKCMTNVQNSQTWFEPYMQAYHYSNYGNHRKSLIGIIQATLGLTEGACDTATFGSGISERGPAGKKLVFCKDISWGIDGLYEYIPDGFRHSFLIRHPYKVFESWDRVINPAHADDESKRMKLSELPEFLLPSGFFYKEQYDLYQHVKEHYEPNPVIIDTDDLLADPGRVLKAYCQAVGIPYSDDLLQWQPGRECMDQQWMIAKEQIMAQNFGNHHAETFTSTCFGKPTKVSDRDEIKMKKRQCSDVCMGYYEDMYANRLQV
ncbi:uncharacterized protein [Amphiura filiformis]|uniref:uncharacterized protein n=1 Tax=Amphiura filiformis TaxID=82378 RepID=UPI003B21C20E